LVVGELQVLLDETEIFGRRVYVGMAEECLHVSEVCSVLKEVTGEGVTKEVRVDVFGGLLIDFIEQPPHVVLIQSLAVAGGEEGRLPVGASAAFLQVLGDPVERRIVYWQEAFLLPLAVDENGLDGEVDVPHVQLVDLIGAQAAPVHHFQHGPVPLASEALGLGYVEDGLHLLDSQRRWWERLFRLGQFDLTGDVGHEEPSLVGPLEKHADGGHVGDATGGGQFLLDDAVVVAPDEGEGDVAHGLDAVVSAEVAEEDKSLFVRLDGVVSSAKRLLVGEEVVHLLPHAYALGWD